MKVFLTVLIVLSAPITYGMDLSQVDIDKLQNLPYREALAILKGKHAQFIENPKYLDIQLGEPRPDLYHDALYWFSKNKNVQRHYEYFFQTTPHTVSTARKRRAAFQILSRMKAEWVVRLMIKELKIDRSLAIYDDTPNPPLTKEDVIQMIENGEHGKLIRNDKKAAAYLLTLQLDGMPSLGLHNTMPNNYLEKARRWVVDNEARLVSLLKTKWGADAVLNDNESEGQMDSVKKTTRERKSKNRGSSRYRKPDASTEKGKSWISFFPRWGWALSIASVCLLIIIWSKLRR